MNIFEVGLSRMPKDIPVKDQFKLPFLGNNTSVDQDETGLPKYNVMMELSLHKVINTSLTSVEITAAAIAHFPESPATVRPICHCMKANK